MTSFSGPQVDVIMTKIAAEKEFLHELRALLAPDELERSERFHFTEHRNAFTVARGLARVILGCHVGIPPSRLHFVYGPCGKPQLDASPIRFNISHSGDMVVYAIAAGIELGVDIEHIKPIGDIEDIAERFFSEGEYRELLGIPPELRTRAFFDCWTRKEALVKALGEGLSHPLKSFQVSLRPARAFDRVTILTSNNSIHGWSLYNVALSSEYSAALAAQSLSISIQRSIFSDALSCSRFYKFL